MISCFANKFGPNVISHYYISGIESETKKNFVHFIIAPEECVGTDDID